MGLDLNRLDPSGLAQLAGTRAPTLNLPLADKSPLGSLFAGIADGQYKRQQIQAEYARLANQMGIAQLGAQTDLARQQMQNQGQLQNTQLNNQGSLNLANVNNQAQAAEGLANRTNTMDMSKMVDSRERQNNLMNFATQQGQLGIGQQNADTNLLQAQGAIAHNKADEQNQKQELALKQLQIEMNARAALKKEDLEHRQVLSSSALSMFQDPKYANNPNLLNQDLQSLFDVAVKSGNISPEERQTLQSSDLGTIKNHLLLDQGISQAAQQLRAVKTQQGNQGLTEKNKTDAQNTVNSNLNMANKLVSATDNFDPQMFKYAGQTQAWLGDKLSRAPEIIQDVASVIPKSVFDPEKAKEFDAQKAGLLGMTNQVLTDYSQSLKKGRTSQTLFNQLKETQPTKDDNPDVFATKTKNFVQILRGDATSNASNLGYNQDQIKNLNDKWDQIENRISTNLSPSKTSSGSQNSGSSSGSVSIVLPDGSKGTIPSANLAQAIKMGAKRV